jgi:hypothetical protein
VSSIDGISYYSSGRLTISFPSTRVQTEKSRQIQHATSFFFKPFSKWLRLYLKNRKTIFLLYTKRYSSLEYVELREMTDASAGRGEFVPS